MLELFILLLIDKNYPCRTTAAAATSAGHGIIATRDGQVYMLELSTGKKLGSLQTFKGKFFSLSGIPAERFLVNLKMFSLLI